MVGIRWFVCAAASLVAMLASTQEAFASTARVVPGVGGWVSYQAAPGETNRVTLLPSNVLLGGFNPGVMVEIEDAGAVVTPGSGCDTITSSRVACEVPSDTGIEFSLGDQDDRFSTELRLPPCAYFAIAGGAGDDVLIGGPDTQMVLGQDGDDRLVGGGGRDSLEGGAGNDSLDGSDGNDILNGGTGYDIADYSSRTAPVRVELDGYVGSGASGTCGGTNGYGADDGEAGEGDNVYNNVEAVYGGAGNDTLTGTIAPSCLVGNDGRDSLFGGPNYGWGLPDWGPSLDRGDVFNGGDGFDSVSYDGRMMPVRVTLGTATGAGDPCAGGSGAQPDDGEAGEADNVFNVEQVDGGFGDDVLIGNFAPNVLSGRWGDDTLVDGDSCLPGGFVLCPDVSADILSGGYGVDTADYWTRAQPLRLTLDGAADDGAPGENDNLSEIENILGGTGNDTLVGNGLANSLTGGQGSDRLEGRGGSDTIVSNDFIAITGLRLVWPDSIFCGSELDTVQSDYADSVGGDCETVNR